MSANLIEKMHVRSPYVILTALLAISSVLPLRATAAPQTATLKITSVETRLQTSAQSTTIRFVTKPAGFRIIVR